MTAVVLLTAYVLTVADGPPAGGWEVRTIPVPTDQPPLEDRGEPLAFSPDAKLVAVAAGSSAFVWEVANGKLVTRLHLGGAGGPSHLAFTADGKEVVATGEQDTVVRWYDLGTGKQVRQKAWERPPLRPGAPQHLRSFAMPAVALSPRADWLLATDYDEGGMVLRTIDLASGRPQAELRTVLSVSNARSGRLVSRNGKLLASSFLGPDGIQVWDVPTGKLLRTLTAVARTQRPAPSLLGVSADGKLLAVDDGLFPDPAGRGSRSRVAVWGVEDGRRWCTFETRGYASPVVFAADGRTLAIGATGATFAVVDLLTGDTLPGVAIRTGYRCQLASPDGKLLAVLDIPNPERPGPTTLMLARFPAPPEPLPTDGALTPPQLKKWWSALGSDNEFRRQYAVRAFAARPDQAVAEIADRIKPEPATRRAMVVDLLGVLNDDSFETRDKAQAELLPLARRFEPLLATAAENAGPGELRNRLSTMLAASARPDAADFITDLSAVAILEAVNTPGAKALLDNLSAGAADSRLTNEAKAALGRLKMAGR